MATPHPVHPLGSQAKILLTSVFGPYARDDEYGSRSVNPMELYHNQVTREQGPFSLRMFHRSFGLMMIEANLDVACTLLDFPTLERFIDELQTHTYDIIGITAILPNYRKVIKMCELIRSHQPQATIVVGGHIAAMPGIERIIDADHIVRGEGVRWFRAFLGQDVGAPVRHPRTLSGFGARSFGITFPERRGETAAVVIPSVGCPMGCNFCSTSALFGGKGKFVNFFETGDDLFAVMRDLEKALQVRSFFVMDENFLLHKARALRLLELMEQHQKSWSLYVFSSAAVLRSYTCEQLVRLGIAWVWMGIEGEHSQYAKLNGVDTRELVRDLQSHGIGVLGSTIIGLEEHTPDNIAEHIAYAVSHATDFHQFMLYTPLPGTPLHEQFRQEGRLLPEQEFSAADTHGQYRFNYRHKHIPPGWETELLRSAFQQDFAANGPSLFRMFRTTLRGWQRYKDHSDARVRDRFRWQARGLATSIAGAVWAMRRWYRNDEPMREKIDALLRDICAAFGWKARCCAPILGRLVYFTLRREAQRLRSGWTYEPPVVYEKNARMRALEKEALFPAVITMPRLQSVVGHLIPTFAVLSRIKVRHRAYRQARLLRKTYGIPVRPSAAAALWERTALRIRAQVAAGQRRLVRLDLHGAFNRHIGRQLKERIETYLRNNAGLLTIDFSGITAAEAKALRLFFKNLRGYRDRIRMVNLDALKADCSDAVAYARELFAEGPVPAENPA